MKTLYCGNINWNAGEQEIAEHLSQHGTVLERVTIIHDRETGRSRGFCFVDVNSMEDAEFLIEKFDQTNHKGRTIVVSIARPRNEF